MTQRLEQREALTFLRLPAVMARVGLKKTAIYARIAAKTFPAPITEGGVSRWVESEIDAYIAGLKARRDGDQNGDQPEGHTAESLI